MKIIVVLASRSFIYYVINVYVPRVRANAYQALTTPPRVFRDPKMCLRNIWTAPNVPSHDLTDRNSGNITFLFLVIYKLI